MKKHFSISGAFMGFNSTVGGGRLTPTAASSAAVAAGFSAGGAFTGPAGLNFGSPGTMTFETSPGMTINYNDL
jgi:hypothetical protein